MKGVPYLQVRRRVDVQHAIILPCVPRATAAMQLRDCEAARQDFYGPVLSMHARICVEN